MAELFGMKEFFDASDFTRLSLRLLVNLSFVWVLVRGIHYRLYRNRELAFTYLLLNIITFSLCFLLRKVPIELGFALGLFAVFGILRYRTEPIRARDLTYLFISIGLAILNAVANKKISLAELLLIDSVILALTAGMAYVPFGRREETLAVIYDNLELLDPEKRQDLIQDLSARVGQQVTWVNIESFDLLRDTARLIINCRSR